MKEPNHTILGIWFKMKDMPFADVKVRRAVSHDVDLKKIVESLAGEAVDEPVSALHFSVQAQGLNLFLICKENTIFPI